jgi:hypothetical protein
LLTCMLTLTPRYLCAKASLLRLRRTLLRIINNKIKLISLYVCPFCCALAVVSFEVLSF